jgi:Sulfotransferase domain
MIIGAAKSGTTSLYKYLKGHPEICPAIKKEPEFFSEHQNHGVAPSGYSELWQFDGAVHRYALEASTGYTKYPMEQNVARNIFNYGIRPKFIYVIRNPFDRIESHFNSLTDTDRWLPQHLVDTSNYFMQLAQYRTYFPRKSFLILDFDDMRREPALVVRRIYDFLGLSHSYFPDRYRVANRTRIETRLERSLSTLGIGTITGLMPRRLRRLGRKVAKSISPAARRVLTSAERSFVESELKADMVRLRDAWRFDVGKWGF